MCIRDRCGAGQDGSWRQYPVKKKAKPPLELQLYTYWIENDQHQILLSDDWSDGLMEGLYRLPQSAVPLELTDQLDYKGCLLYTSFQRAGQRQK